MIISVFAGVLNGDIFPEVEPHPSKIEKSIACPFSLLIDTCQSLHVNHSITTNNMVTSLAIMPSNEQPKVIDIK